MVNPVSQVSFKLSGLPERPKDSPQRIEDAARQFESLLLTQMMRSVREADSSGWLGTDGDSANDSAMEIAEQQFGQALSTGGGLGLARLIASGLKTKAG